MSQKNSFQHQEEKISAYPDPKKEKFSLSSNIVDNKRLFTCDEKKKGEKKILSF